MDSLLKAISQYPNGTGLIIEWGNGNVISGDIDTIYETDNELELNNKNYKEFYACLLNVKNIIQRSNQNDYFNEGDLLEVSMQNPPLRVQLNDGTIIWEQK